MYKSAWLQVAVQWITEAVSCFTNENIAKQSITSTVSLISTYTHTADEASHFYHNTYNQQ